MHLPPPQGALRPRRRPRPRHLPAACGNAAFTRANRDALRTELARIGASLTQAPALPPYLQHTLTARRLAITALLGGQEDEPA